MNTTFTQTYTIKDIYNTSNPEIPEGYKATEFRFAKEGEYYLYRSGGNYISQRAVADHLGRPHIILTPLPSPVVVKGNVENTITITVKDIYGSDVQLPEGYEFVDFRSPGKEEIFINLGGTCGMYISEVCSKSNTKDSRIIVKKCS